MKKEVLIAILIGIGVSLLVTAGYLFWQNQKTQNLPILSPLSDKSTSQPASSGISGSLTIISPLDESFTNEPKTKILGSAPPQTWILILTEKGEKLVQTNNEGNFETEVSLVSGENQLEFKCFDQNQEIAQKTITIVYTTAEI